MTQHARFVLADAKEALMELPHYGTTSGDESTIRRRYVALMALLRAVGNVLHDVDRAQGPRHLQRAIDEKWLELNKKPPIIWDFIKDSRAAVLKRYELPEVDFDIIMGRSYPVLVTEGMDVFGLSEGAIEFWEQYLDAVDNLADQYLNASGN